jgi:hypothetical protein
MDINNMFQSSFVESVNGVVQELRSQDKTPTQAEICNRLGLHGSDSVKNRAMTNVISNLIALGAVEGYARAAGRGLVATDRKTVPYPDGFLENLQGALDALFDDADEGTYIPADKVVKHMEAKTSAKPLIGQAIRNGDVTGYVSEVGKGKGIRRVTSTVSPQEMDSESTADSE